MFSRFANEEAKQKNYSRHVGQSSGIKIADHLINYTLSEARKSQLPVYPFFSDDQRGNNFGERLSNAIEDVFLNGYQNVIVVGGDSPSVTSSLLKQTDEKLNEHALVLAPAKDGGVFLIGISIEGYNKDCFLEIPWLSNEVFNALEAYAIHSSLTLAIAAPGEDIDDITSLLEWVNTYTSHELYSFLHCILQVCRQIKQHLLFRVQLPNPIFSCFKLRGPPAYL